MKKYCVQLLLIKIIYLILPENASQIERIKQDSTHGYAGEFTLSQAWPHTWCYLFKRLDPKKTCQSTYVDRWSILQFVPRLPSGNYYSECNHSTPFKFDEISQIRAELESRWFSFDAAQNLTDFWKDQWENSGVCGLSNDQTNSQLKYFNKGLELSGKFNMARILSEANIIPGHNYTKQTIVDAVSYVLGDKRAVIACQRHRKTYEYYLLDVLIWFNKDFEPTIRGHEVIIANDCPDNETIIYPNSKIDQ
ncbi:ribonuclease Oy-like [Cotesia typhae]|uniref:ribonuclease Oy-like n=1 Tax=Cotesia typhae TaxID=2053667 RepID=UPI003D694ABA